MKIFLAEHAGFCDGVKNALNLALRQAAKKKKVTTLGPLVHNEKVVQFLMQKKIGVVSHPEELEKGVVIIRTHGVTPQILKYLQSRTDLETIDATCSYVKRVQKIASNFSRKGFQVIIYGDRYHPEVQALLGWIGEKARVIEPGKLDLLEGLSFSPGAVLISQTTQREEDFWKVAAQIQSVYPQLEIYKTICRATMLRQNAAASLASQVDLMLVVGDNQSSNTRKLSQVCREIRLMIA